MALTDKQRAKLARDVRAPLRAGVKWTSPFANFFSEREAKGFFGEGGNKKDARILLENWRKSFARWLETVK